MKPHPLTILLVQSESIIVGIMLGLSGFSAANPIRFSDPHLEIPHPVIVRFGNPSSRKRFATTGYRGKIGRRK